MEHLVIRQELADHLRLEDPLRLRHRSDEGNAYDVRSPFHGHTDVQFRVGLADVFFPLGGADFPRGERSRSGTGGGFSPDRESSHNLAVDAEVELVPSPHPADVILPIRLELDPEPILAIGREVVAGGDPTAGSKGQFLALPIGLGQEHRVLEPHEAGRGRQADRKARDFPCRREVALELGGRDREDVGIVVKPRVRCLISRKERVPIDLEHEEVTNRVGVFSAVQAVHRTVSARIGTR